MPATNARLKLCPVKGCAAQVPIKLLMCSTHWSFVPRPMRSQVWRYYRAGQERSGLHSPMYAEAARNAIKMAESEEALNALRGGATQLKLL